MLSHFSRIKWSAKLYAIGTLEYLDSLGGGITIVLFIFLLIVHVDFAEGELYGRIVEKLLRLSDCWQLCL